MVTMSPGQSLMSRKCLPARRRSWTQHVRIGGQSIYLCVGEYPDGSPGEVFIDVSRQGTLLRGVMGSLARMISISLQCGSGVDLIIKALRGLAYPPDGPVLGSSAVSECSSVTDWIAQELEARYLCPPPESTAIDACAAGDVYTPPVERVAGAYAAGSGV